MTLEDFKLIFDNINYKEFINRLYKYKQELIKNNIIVVYYFDYIIIDLEGVCNSGVFKSNFLIDNKLKNGVYSTSITNIDCGSCGNDESILCNSYCNDCEVIKSGRILPIDILYINDTYWFYTSPQIYHKKFKVYSDNDKTNLVFQGLILSKGELKHNYV